MSLRMSGLIILTILIWLLILNPIGLYLIAKTYSKGTSDCMVIYINKYYPNGCEYKMNIKGKTINHIDKCGLENDSLKLIGKVNGCNIKTGSIINAPYCYYTLMFEIIGKNLKRKT